MTEQAPKHVRAYTVEELGRLEPGFSGASKIGLSDIPDLGSNDLLAFWKPRASRYPRLASRLWEHRGAWMWWVRFGCFPKQRPAQSLPVCL